MSSSAPQSIHTAAGPQSRLAIRRSLDAFHRDFGGSSVSDFVGNAIDPDLRRGRGAVSRESGRFEALARMPVHDGWDLDEERVSPRTEVQVEKARSIITRNDSPDLSFDRSLNPYRGCEHGCVYCFARPTHAYMGFSPGLDFETKLFAKTNAAELLAKELDAPGYEPRTLAIGTNTDAYQPIEREQRIMRDVLQVLSDRNHPVGIVTKSALITRDIDLLGPMAEKGLAKVAISITTLDRDLARKMEPRAATPEKRLDAIRQLVKAGIPVTVLVAPVIPGLNDHEIEAILAAARAAGATEAGYVMLRLPMEVKTLFREWLFEHVPGKFRHVMSLVQSTREGKDYDPRFGQRQTGTGPYAWLTGRRFQMAAEKLGFNRTRLKLKTDLFLRHTKPADQLSLF
jgi:DNA repair photolyase